MIADLWRASRPFSWINTALPFFALAWATHGGFTPALILGAVYFLAPYNLLLYGVNDLYDYASDRQNPRKGGAIEGGLMTTAGARQLWFAIALSNLPILAALVWLGGRQAGAALALTVAVALAYSMPPFRTKVIPALDSATSSLHFVLPCVCGGLVAGARLNDLPWSLLLAFFLWGMASHALGAIQDVRYDREAGIGSIAVALGPRNTARFSLAGYGAAVVLVASRGGVALVAAAALAPYVLLAASCLGAEVERQARRAWRGFLGLNLLTGFIITQLLLHVWGLDNFTVLSLLAWGSAAGVLASLVHAVVNERSMRRTAPAPAHWPSLSVVVPVRNEASTIERCLKGIRAQKYDGAWEAIVVDDGSDDGTAEIVSRTAQPGVRILQPGPAPSSWTGKCWAADHGVQAAHGDILIFLDADTTLEPNALRSLVAEIVAHDGLLSILTRYRMDGIAERIFMPAFVQIQLCFLPIAWMNAWHRRLPNGVFAYGPCIVVSRHIYEESGGHAAIRFSNNEDIDLARLIAGAGYRVRFLRGADLASTRHYRNLDEIVGCWRRTYYAYGGTSLAVALAGMLGVAVIFLLPLCLPFLALRHSDESALVGSLVGLAGLIVLRIVLAWRERQPLITILAHPVTWFGTILFQALSTLDGLRGFSPRWRGRSLPPEPMETPQ
jgi:4-hydroxybenzoate polyprenyltransferase/cellulose synthase/poly-beta-1,6-N-acetylglucosamine synthase-like glycosyltransferase